MRKNGLFLKEGESMKAVGLTIIEFLVTLLIVYLLYYLFMISKYDKNGKLKKKNKSSFFYKLYLKIKLFILPTKNEKDEILDRGRKPKKIKEEKDDIKIPTEVEILIIKYNIDLSKINYKKLLKIVGFTCSIDIATILSIVSLLPTDNIYIELLVGGVLIIPVILISYSILGKYFKKKGIVKKDEKRNASNKRNRK